VDIGGQPSISLIQNGSTSWQLYSSYLGPKILMHFSGTSLAILVVEKSHEMFDCVGYQTYRS